MQQEMDFKHCIRALSNALSLSAKALQTEIAVAFVVFHDIGSTAASAKKALRQIYSDAGQRDCLTPESPAYQTVIRRINRITALFEIIGWRKVKRALKGLDGEAAIAAAVALVEPLDLRSMDDVAAYAGRPRKPEEEQIGEEAEEGTESDEVEVIHVRTRHIDVSIPPGTPARELVNLANKLLAMAKEMEEVAPS